MEWLKNRVNIFKIVVIFIFIVLVMRLFILQVIKGDDYYNKSVNIVYRKLPITAPRGDIVDTYGRKIAMSNTGYVVNFDVNLKYDDKKLNTILLRLIKILERNKEKHKDNFPITDFPYKFDSNQRFSINDFSKLSNATFDNNWILIIKYSKNSKYVNFEFKNKKTKRTKIYKYKPSYVLKAFRKNYKISNKLNKTDLRYLIGLRYEIDTQKSNFKTYEPINLANGISDKTICEIEESHKTLPGVLIDVAPIREYNSQYAVDSPIVGYVSKITEEEYKKADKKLYGMSDIYGQLGIERYAEKYLKGKDGTKYVEADNWGRKKREISSTPPKKGNTVVLTIDNSLQKVAEESLKRNIMIIRNGQDGRKAGKAVSGAVVAMDVHTGEVLSLVSYPYFNSNDFIKGMTTKQYNERYNNNNKGEPLWNKAISEAYPPGSTFKILTAMAALQENKIGPNDQIYDRGVYPHTNLKCLEYALGEGGHGMEDIKRAIQVSCNYFFYEMGNRLGINKIDEYATKFGLGKKTGIELDNEVSGQVASPELRKKLYADPEYKKWYFGFTLQSAIGQCDTALTPIQIANYLCTIVNGGNKLQTHIVKKVVSPQGKTVMENKTKVLDKIKLRPEVFATVKEGMRRVTTENSGTASGAFADFPIKIGGKTGSATVGNQKEADAWFMGFAPYNNPKIVVVAFVKLGSAGASAAYIARDVMEQYFGLNNKNTSTNVINYNKGFK